MTKILLVLLLSLSLSTASAVSYRVMGYYPQGVYGDYVIVYSYYASDGQFRLSHCRTNAVAQDIYSNKTYLDINTCTIKMLPPDGTAPTQAP